MSHAQDKRSGGSNRCSAKTLCCDMDANLPRRRTPVKERALADVSLKPLQVGLLGIGTVGLGTWTVLRRNEEEITRRAGRPIRITWIADMAQARAREVTRGAEINLTADAKAVLAHPDIDIVVELIGGI